MKNEILSLRINSPGGSVSSSKMMRDELLGNVQEKVYRCDCIPGVITPQEGYISTNDYIFAEPTTITGSIGVALLYQHLKMYDYIGEF